MSQNTKTFGFVKEQILQNIGLKTIQLNNYNEKK